MKKNNTQRNHNEAKGNNSWQALEGLTIGIDLGDKRSNYCVLGRRRPRRNASDDQSATARIRPQPATKADYHSMRHQHRP